MGALVGRDNPVLVALDLPQANESTADEGGPAGRVRRGEFLAVGIKGGRAAANQYLLLAPFTEPFGSARVDVVGSGVGGPRLALDQPRVVIGAAPEIFLLHRGRDLVEGLGDDLRQRA